MMGAKGLEAYLKGLRINVLTSFYGAKDLFVPPFCHHLFLDSGAFSALRKKVKIDVADYTRFVHKWKSLVHIYASLDIIGDAVGSYKQWQSMRKAGLDPIPCFHIGEPWEYLDMYVQQTAYIALGGVAKSATPERSCWLDEVFAHIGDLCIARKLQVHGFGISDEETILRYPWESVDASSVHIMSRYGGIYTPWGTLKINPEVNEHDRKWQSSLVAIKTIKEWVESIGFDFEEARPGSPAATLMRCAISIYYFEGIIKKASEQKK